MIMMMIIMKIIIIIIVMDIKNGTEVDIKCHLIRINN